MATTPQSYDERLNKIASTLMLARAAMAGDTQSAVLVDLSDDDTAFFEASLASGEYLDFLDRNPQFSALDASDAPDLTWDEYAAAGQSVDDFVNSFRRSEDASEGASTAVPASHGSDETASTTKAEPQPAIHFYNVEIPWSKVKGDEVASAIRGSGIFSASNVETAPLYAIKRLTSPVRTSADAFADAIGPNAKALLFAARSNRNKWSTLSAPIDLDPAQWPNMCAEIVGILARHAGMTPDLMREAAVRWLHEVSVGQAPGYSGVTVYLQKDSVKVEPRSGMIPKSAVKPDKSRH